MDPPTPQQFYSDRGGRRNRGNFQPYQRRHNNNRNWNQNNRSFGHGHHHEKDDSNVNIESYLHPSFFENPWKDLLEAPQQKSEAQSKILGDANKEETASN